jgi:hypothetical protein
MDLDELLSNTAAGVCAITGEGKITFWRNRLPSECWRRP